MLCKSAFLTVIIGFAHFIPSQEKGSFFFTDQNQAFYFLANRLDCYFTIEESVVSKIDRRGWKCFNQSLSFLDHVKTIDDLVIELPKGLPGCKFLRSKTAPWVIHIVSNDIPEGKNALDRVISIKYKGTPSGLLREISTYGMGVNSPTVGSFPERNFDGKTVISVFAENKALRDVLTDCLPFSAYNRLLWVSEQFKDTGFVFVRYKYPQMVFHNLIDNYHDKRNIPGELGFIYSSRHNINHDISVQKIKEAKKSEHAVKWAMYHLGANKFLPGINVLDDHLEYKIGNCTLLEENFPSVKALALFGPEIGPFLLEKVAKEKQDLRLKLYARFFFLALSPKQRNELFSQLELLPDQDQQNNIKKCMSYVKEFE